ncbi:MAG TPA: OB-fold domain-containing protein [Acidimicrobiales bacterium]|nr:OB-fold domain-containing protein [Acidimicrobiales bacterium]
MTETSTRTSETKLEFPYSRTLGPVMGAFIAGLREGRLLGIRGADGRVLVPPMEYDPQTGESLGTELVPVGPGGTVESWAWVDDPTPKHPLQHPFAFALVRPDGADTAIVSAVDAGSIETMSSGMRVAARFASEPKGLITDLEAWEPEKR